MTKLSIVFLLLIVASLAHSLEIDQKLTMRVLRVSNSMKTVLVNRGIEDGLAEGDHAKFFLSVGVVARAKIIKISPTRSVWSLYRIVNADYIKKDTVMNLKITDAMKISSDQTKAVVEDDQSLDMKDPEKLGIPLAEGANDLTPGLSAEEQKQVAAMQVEVENLAAKNFEVTFSFDMTQWKSSTSNDTGTLVASGNNVITPIRFAGEYYFIKEKDWYSNLSLQLGYSVSQVAILAYNGNSITSSSSEINASLFWHFMGKPTENQVFYPYFMAGMIMGSVSEKFSSSLAVESTASGSRSGRSIGGGVKYYFRGGWGARLEIQMNSLSDKLTDSTLAVVYTRKISGPRAFIGLSYRW